MEKQRILALSGANELLLVAVQGEELHYHAYHKGFQHNEQIAGLCQELLAQAGLQQQDLTALAVDLGPGSFTGQRISLSFAKGLSFALCKPLVGFDTFALWRHSAYCCCKAAPLLILIDGRKRRFYARLFENATGAVLATWDLGSQDLCQEILHKYGSKLVSKLYATGPGCPMFLEELASTDLLVWQGLEFCPPPDEAALAASMLALAQREYQAQSFMKASDGPLYLRKSDAEKPEM